MVYNIFMTEPKTDRYMLVDGNALIHRGYHAIPVLNTKTGEQTNAVYGFTMILLKALKDIKPTHIACTFDLAGPTFRHEQYKEYKATRVKADQELYDQIPRVKEVVRALNIPIYEQAGFEADDCLGTLAVHIHKQDPEAEILIVTGDLDTLQLVNHKIKVYTMRKGITDTVIYDAKAVRERYGLNPEQMIDYKALRGDPSDNIPGVKGIGEKGAGDLIKDFGSLENLYKGLRASSFAEATEDKKGQGLNIKPRIIKLLQEQEDQARQSYDLSRIRLNVPLNIDIPKYDFDTNHQKQIFELFKQLEFRSLLAKLPNKVVSSKYQVESKNILSPSLNTNGEPVESINEGEEGNLLRAFGKPARQGSEPQAMAGGQDYRLVDTEEKLKELIKILSKSSEVVIDTETTGLNSFEDKLVGVGFCVKPGEAFYVPAELFLHSEELKEILSSDKIKKIGHNIKFDSEVLEANSYNLKACSFDTMIASYLLNAGTRQHNLEALAFNELGYQMQPIEELIGKGKTQITMDKVGVEKVSWYCCEDVDMTFRLKELFEPKLKEQNLLKIFEDIEMPLVEILAQMEKMGILLDVKMLNRLSGEAEILINELQSDIYKLTGQDFNISSPKQLKEVLFEKMGLVPVENRKTKTGLSTSADNLEKMLGQHPVISKILEFREITKLQNTYLEALPLLVSKKDKRIHTSYNQTVAATGRLSSSDPNLQNIPVRGEGLGSEIRKAFVAEKGYKFLSIDYSQIELRVVAHLSGDKKMLEVFKSGQDIHQKTAMEIFGVTADKVTKDMRRDAKTINFGILYGVSSFGLSARITDMSRFEAKEYIKKYFEAYPKVEEYLEQVKLQVNEEAFVKNELGRLRRFPEIKSSQFFIRAAAERAAINFPIQSLAADVIKVAMINIYKDLLVASDKWQDDCRMLLQVHDELLFEVREDKVQEWSERLIPIMENAIKLSVPVKVDAKVGNNWGDMQKLAVSL